jgi:hypothetical protein
MTDLANLPHTSDICLLLRAHGEQLWLDSKVIPVIRQLEQRDALPEDQLGAALAYLEVLWIEARTRAAETDAAYAAFGPASADADASLHEKAHRYHAALRRLRTSLANRVERLLATDEVSTSGPSLDLYASS